MNFDDLYDSVKDRLQISRERMYTLLGYVAACCDLKGEFWECGVFNGGSARVLAEALRELRRKRTLRLFDTFSGFPGVAPQDGDYPRIGMFNETSVESVRKYVDASFASLHQGIIPETFKGLENTKIAFAHLDMDLYEPTKASLEFVLPRLLKGGVVIIDDYGDSHYPGVAAAVDQFGRKLTVNAFGEHDRQAVIIEEA
jgi:hypothetical protein